jgi:hypothetical protein
MLKTSIQALIDAHHESLETQALWIDHCRLVPHRRTQSVKMRALGALHTGKIPWIACAKRPLTGAVHSAPGIRRTAVRLYASTKVSPSALRDVAEFAARAGAQVGLCIEKQPPLNSRAYQPTEVCIARQPPRGLPSMCLGPIGNLVIRLTAAA